MERPPAVQQYLARKGSEMANAMWDRRDSPARRERAAIGTYARILKNQGKDQADAWVREKFGPRADELLALPQFKKQWYRYL